MFSRYLTEGVNASAQFLLTEHCLVPRPLYLTVVDRFRVR